MGTVVAFALGALAVAAVAVPFVVRQHRRSARADDERRRLADAAERDGEILAAAPDGLFLWDHVNGGESCSRRLAVLLGLAAGTQSRFADVRARFEGETAAVLDKAVAALRRDGTAFDLLLPAAGRMVQAVGVRAGAVDGRPLADLLWMRDVSATSDAAQSAGAAAVGPAETGGTLRALLDALPVPVWLRGADLDLAFTNRACAGGAIEESLRDLAMRATTEGKAVAERHLLSVGGAERLLEVTETPMEGWAGTAGFAIDRSPGRDTEETSPGDAAAQDQVLQNLATAIAIFGPDTRLRFFNAAYAELWHVDAGWLDSEPGLAEVLERLRELRRLPEYADFRAFKEEQIARFGTLAEPVDSLLHLPDGTTLRSVVSPYALGGLVFTYEDVTDRLDLERSYNTLIAVQGATLDNLYEGVAVFGSDGRLKLSNPALAELWNLSEEDLGGEPHLSDFVEKMRPFIIGEDDWAAHKERVIKRLMRREPSSGRLLRGDGTVLDYANLPLPDGAVLLSYLNVTDSVRVQLALRQRAEAMEEANRLKSEFIANVSYEVRTPLNTIVGFAEILTEEYFGKLNQRQMEYSRGIVEASQNLTSVISDILDLASIEAGTMALELDTVDLHTMLAGVLNLTRERARRKALKVEFDCPPDIGWMVADEKRIKQVLFNLLSNAVAFTPPHGTIRLSAWRDGDDIAIAVADTGVGIPQADQERVLRTFERGGAPDARQGGAGLGLSLVTRFIELHGGQVEVKSAPNKGTTVTCRLPSGAAEEEG